MRSKLWGRSGWGSRRKAGGGGEREAGEERTGGGTRVESRTNRGKLRNNASYFAIDIGPNGESRGKNGGSRECNVWRAEGLDPPVHAQKVFSSLRSRRLEVVGEREGGRARGKHARGDSFSRARFFLSPLLPSARYTG